MFYGLAIEQKTRKGDTMKIESIRRILEDCHTTRSKGNAFSPDKMSEGGIAFLLEHYSEEFLELLWRIISFRIVIYASKNCAFIVYMKHCNRSIEFRSLYGEITTDTILEILECII